MVGAIAGLTTVILVMYFGLTRVFSGHVPRRSTPRALPQVNPRTQTPVRIIAWSGSLMATFSAFVPIHELAG